MISLLSKETDFFTLTTDSLDMALDFILLGAESLLELDLVTLAVSETSAGVTVGFAFFRLTGGPGLQVQYAWY
jgi:hypothetical protein